MKRDLTTFAKKEYDLIIVGAGAFGSCAVWEAVTRGLKVALVEQGDFCGATSANHYKMVHGGIRYLQHADFYRVRESCHERSALLRIAPHLVQPLPIVIPTYGHGTKGKAFLRSAFAIYDLLTLDRNSGIPDPARRIPRGRFISRREILNLFPGIETKGLTGGAVLSDGQYYNPPRLALSFIKSAVNEGADVANYLKVTDILRNRNRVFGVKVKDVFGGDVFEIRAKMVLITAGPWSHYLLENGADIKLDPEPTFSRDLGFVVRRKASHKYCFASQIKSGDKDAIMDRGGRHIFIAPWRDYTLVGVWHKIFNGRPEEVSVTKQELQAYIDDVNESYPALSLSVKDISMVLTGLTLFADEHAQGKSEISFGKRSRIIDHGKEHSIEGLITLIGVRATTARGKAEQIIDIILEKLGKRKSKSKTATIPVYGGDIECFEDFLDRAMGAQPYSFNTSVMRSLIHNYGSRYEEVLKYIKDAPELGETVSGSQVIKSEIVHAVREEMAQKLEDVIFRRTDLGTAGHPGKEALEVCADLMTKEMGWTATKKHQELDDVEFKLLRRGFFKEVPDTNEIKTGSIQ